MPGKAKVVHHDGNGAHVLVQTQSRKSLAIHSFLSMSRAEKVVCKAFRLRQIHGHSLQRFFLQRDVFSQEEPFH